MARTKTIGILMVAMIVVPLALTPLVVFAPAAAFRLQVVLIPVSGLVSAHVSYALGRLVEDGPARLSFWLAAVLNAVNAMADLVRLIGVNVSAARGFLSVTALNSMLLFAVGLWRGRFTAMWIPVAFVLSAALVIATRFIPKALIDAGSGPRYATFSINWWLLPVFIGGMATAVAWVAIGFILIRRDVRGPSAAV